MSNLHTRDPRATPAVAGVAVVTGLLLVGVGVVTVHDLAVDRGWASGSTWVPAAVDALDGTTAGAATSAVGVVLAVLGVALLVLAVLPGRRTHVSAGGDGDDLWLTPGAVAVLARDAADAAPAVLATRETKASRGRVRLTVVTARTADRGEEAASGARAAAERALSALSAPPTVHVRPTQEVSS